MLRPSKFLKNKVKGGDEEATLMREDWTMKTISPMKMKYVLAFGAAMVCAPHVGGEVPLTGPFTPAPGTAQAAF